MKKQFSLDLRVARRQAGFTQRDIAHLLGMGQAFVSDLEQGRKEPTLRQIVKLSLIFGKSFESLFAEIMADARRDLRKRLTTLPKDTRRFAGTFNRDNSIARLQDRLDAEAEAHD